MNAAERCRMVCPHGDRCRLYDGHEAEGFGCSHNPPPEGCVCNGPNSPMAGLYWWVRDVDETGMSGAGRVAQVAVFEDGSAVMRWLASRNSAGVGSSVFYATVRDLVFVHGHGERRTGHLEAA